MLQDGLLLRAASTRTLLTESFRLAGSQLMGYAVQEPAVGCHLGVLMLRNHLVHLRKKVGAAEYVIVHRTAAHRRNTLSGHRAISLRGAALHCSSGPCMASSRHTRRNAGCRTQRKASNRQQCLGYVCMGERSRRAGPPAGRAWQARLQGCRLASLLWRSRQNIRRVKAHRGGAAAVGTQLERDLAPLCGLQQRCASLCHGSRSVLSTSVSTYTPLLPWLCGASRIPPLQPALTPGCPGIPTV